MYIIVLFVQLTFKCNVVTFISVYTYVYGYVATCISTSMISSMIIDYYVVLYQLVLWPAKLLISLYMINCSDKCMQLEHIRTKILLHFFQFCPVTFLPRTPPAGFAVYITHTLQPSSASFYMQLATGIYGTSHRLAIPRYSQEGNWQNLRIRSYTREHFSAACYFVMTRAVYTIQLVCWGCYKRRWHTDCRDGAHVATQLVCGELWCEYRLGISVISSREPVQIWFVWADSVLALLSSILSVPSRWPGRLSGRRVSAACAAD